MIEFPFECSIVRRTAGTALDDYGNQISMLGTIATVCDLQQISRTEPPLAGETGITTWAAYLPSGTEIDTGDALVVGNKVYELIGDPWDANTGSNMVNHLEATVTLQGGV